MFQRSFFFYYYFITLLKKNFDCITQIGLSYLGALVVTGFLLTL